MATYVYITKQCQKEINHQQYGSQVDGFRKKVEATQNLEVFDRFPPPFLKKRFERQIRLVAREYILKDHIVVAFLRLLVRGGSEYKQFGDQGYKELPGFDGMAAELSVEALTTYVNGRQDPPPPPPPRPNDKEEAFLHSALHETEDIYADAHCCETKLWVDLIASTEFKDRKPAFIEALLETLDGPTGGLQAIQCPKDKTFGILFRRIADRNMVILFAPFRGDPPLNLVRSQYPELVEEEEPDKEDVLRKAKRAYPHELVLNDTAWFNVQNDEDGNMALSIEEIDVLESARVTTGGFPLFINGSAGSGKSTILQYLFAEYLLHHCKDGKTTPTPVLFACNDELLARSQASIRSLMRARLGRDGTTENPDEWIKLQEGTLQKSLLNFHKWLHRLAPSDMFPPDLMVDYASFKAWWEDRFRADPGARKLYNPDVSWHVIRTYIKGISTDDVLDPDDYLEIPSKQKSVTPETYRIVYDNVWKKYHEDQKSKGLWDHQDLARYVLENELIQIRYPVVFCDEAQDFTRIELEVLHQLCLFNSRTLNSFQLPQVPIAFAGDPFQTLNPTGFRWEATQAFFTDKFIKSYPGQKRGEINYQELTYNYRSSHHIVRFINSLQLARSVIFGFPEIKPQHPWEDDENVPRVVYFERNAETLGQLQKQSEIRIVVPCEAGQEGQWAQDNGLANYVEFDDAGIPKNVVSPTGVKGLEFPRVVLFGFGEHCPPQLRNALEKLVGGSESTLEEMQPDEAIEPQYFWNRLYVAASRPRKRLFIIDDNAHIESFWHRIFGNQEATIIRARDGDKWEGMTGQLIKGDDDAWEGDEEDPLKTAQKLEEEGRLRRDRTLLRQAAQSFKSAKRHDDEKRCRAQALELESRYLDAARLWLELANIDNAMLAAWNAKEAGLEFIVGLAERQPNVRNDIHWKVADFLKGSGGLSDGVVLLKEIADSLNLAKLHEEILMSGVWLHMLVLVIQRLLQAGEVDSGRWAIAYRHAKSLADAGLVLPHAAVGDLAFRGQDMAAAHSHWDRVPIEKRTSYESRFLLAKASILPYPESLETWNDILRRQTDKDLAQEVLELVHREGADRLTDAQFTALLRANLIIGKIDDAFAGLDRTSDIGLVCNLWEQAMRGGQEPVQIGVLERLTRILMDGDDWHGVASLLARGALPALQCRGIEDFARLHPRKHAIPIVRVLAEVDNGLETAENSVRTRVGELVSKVFPISLNWRHEIHPLIVGRALERAGLFRLTLPYYEAVANHVSVSKDLRKWAWGRWSRTKVQQVAIQGNRKGLNEAREKAATYGFVNPDNVPENLPNELPAIDEPPAPLLEKPGDERATKATTTSDKIADKPLSEESSRGFAKSLRMDSLEIRVFPDGSRINLTHAESGEVLSLHPARGEAQLEGIKLRLGDDATFDGLPPNWPIKISLARVDAGKVDLIGPDGTELALPVAKTA